ncbi:MAG: YidC/Oxa1 family membrane protein insertase [Ruminococcaceae bacterium]|nr:YidC/Oxa1 family membrane protein insertase [Oscillospiraceae bacterium]
MGNLMDIINVPLALLLKLCYMLVNNYGVAIILFAVLTKVLLFPLGIKGEKSRLQQVAMQPKVNALQQKFKGNTRDPKYNEELQALYNAEGFSPFAGCLPQLIQLPIILGLWNAIRQPLTYISGLGQKTLYTVVHTLYDNGVANIVTELEKYAVDGVLDPDKVVSWLKSSEIRLATIIGEGSNMELLSGVLPEDFELLNMSFFGLNLGMKPSDYGLLALTTLIPILSGVTSFLGSFIIQKINGTSDNSQNGSMNMLLYTMPLISIWLGYSFPIGVGIYWIASNLLNMLQSLVLKLVVKPAEKEVKKKKEKKLNYTQIEKMKREGTWTDAIEVSAEDQTEVKSKRSDKKSGK